MLHFSPWLPRLQLIQMNWFWRVGFVVAITTLCSCGILPLRDHVLGDAKSLAPADRAIFTAKASGPSWISLLSLDAHNDTWRWGGDDYGDWRIAVKPGPVELKLRLANFKTRSGAVTVKCDAKAGKHYVISAKVTNNADGTQKWEPIITEK